MVQWQYVNGDACSRIKKMERPPYKNATTLDFVTWLARHEGIGNAMSKCHMACKHFPQVPASIKHYATGVHDVRKAVLKHFPVTPGEKRTFDDRQTTLDLFVSCWRQYQCYLRSRDDREAVQRHYAERMASAQPIAQESGNA
jgi:hypothetical protein